MRGRLQRSLHLVLSLAAVWAIDGPAAVAQQGQAVTTLPAQGTTLNGNASGTVAVTNTFQMVFGARAPSGAATGTRRGCTIQNNGTHNMYVTEGLGVAASSLTNSVILPPTYIYTCSINGAVLYGEIDLTGTATEAFYAAQW